MSQAHVKIHPIDLNYLGKPHAINSFAVIGADGVPVLIETGPANTVEHLDAGLREIGFSLDDVRDVMITHIHLDHAAATGALAKHGCRIHVHEFGAKHLIDPSRLLASAERIYGDEMDHLWGQLEAVPEAQVVPLHHDDVVDAGRITFRVMETPGHARHHHAFIVEDTHDGRVCFTGDAAATCVPQSSFISLPTPPPEFDLAQWFDTIDRIDAEHFDALFLTHGGRITDVAPHLQRVRDALHAHVETLDRLTAHGTTKDDTTLDQYHAWIVEQADAMAALESTRWFYVNRSMSQMNLTGYLRWKKQQASP